MESLVLVQTSKAADLIRKARSDEIKGQGYISRSWCPWAWSLLQRMSELVSQKLVGKRLDDLESIHLFIAAPFWTPLEVMIDGNVEIAMK
jgi:hypothetical protein